jgi:hypothetical protein
MTSISPIEQKLTPMASRLPTGAARVSRRGLRGAVVSLIVGWLTLAYAGCSYFAAKPVAPTQQQMAAYGEQQAALRREASLPNEQPQEVCDQLAIATPGVEELRTTRGSVESRQWRLIANGSAPRWAFVRAEDGPADGWSPKPGIAKLGFQPPLEPALTAGSSHFLAYAPVESVSPEDSQKSAIMREAFGAAQGDFSWRGRKYSYTLTSELPCFPLEQ